MSTVLLSVNRNRQKQQIKLCSYEVSVAIQGSQAKNLRISCKSVWENIPIILGFLRLAASLKRRAIVQVYS